VQPIIKEILGKYENLQALLQCMHLEEHAAMVNKQPEENASLVICNLEEHAAILKNMQPS
jgi:hypothetical protein